MQFILNGQDLETTYGVIITNGVNAMMALPDRKASVSHDFPEQDGLDIDLTQPRFSARAFVFNCVLHAISIQDLQNKYFALFTMLRGAGSYQLFNSFLNLTINIYYTKQSNIGNIYKSVKNGVEGYAIKFDLNFNETNPDDNIPNIYLTNQDGQFLIPS